MVIEKLIEAVICYPCLWNVTKTCYKDMRARENAWKEVVIPDACSTDYNNFYFT